MKAGEDQAHRGRHPVQRFKNDRLILGPGHDREGSARGFPTNLLRHLLHGGWRGSAIDTIQQYPGVNYRQLVSRNTSGPKRLGTGSLIATTRVATRAASQLSNNVVRGNERRVNTTGTGRRRSNPSRVSASRSREP